MRDINKKEELIIFECDGSMNLEQFREYTKLEPIEKWSNYIIFEIVFSLLLIISMFIQKISLYQTILLFLVVSFIALLIDLLNFDVSVIKKYRIYEERIKNKTNNFKFYKTFLLKNIDGKETKLEYFNLKKIIETDDNIHIINNFENLCIKKENISDKKLNFIRNINKKGYKRYFDKMEMLTINKGNKILNVIFLINIILTLIIICFARQNFITYKTEEMWKILNFFPLVILLLLFTIKLKKTNVRFNTKKTLFSSIIIILTILFFSIYSLKPYSKKDYNDTFKYENIMGLELPSKGILEKQLIPKSTIYMSDTSEYHVYFYDENIEKIENDISNSDIWIDNNSLEEELKIFVEDEFFDDVTRYYLIYNIDTKEYNCLPSKNGKYRYYLMEFSKYNKILKIKKFNYLYEEN